MRINKKYFLGIAIFIALFAMCFFAIKPLFVSGFFTIHDDEQIARLYEMYTVIGQGQIPPRWVPDLGFGFGFPLFNFYPPFVYYLGSLLHVFGLSLITATKTVMGLGFFLAAASMFFWVKKHYGVLAGFFAALLYTYAPYHSVDIYVRGALAEFFTWVWIPAIFLSIDFLFEKLEKRYIVLFGILFALLMLTHTLVMLQFGPLLLLYAGGSLFLSRKRIRQKVVYFTYGIILGLGLSAYFWIPSLAEKQYTLVDAILTKELANYAIHFVCPIQLWSSPWGYGGSVAGCVDGLSFQVGKIQALVAVAGVLLSIFFVLRKRMTLGLIGSVLFLCSIFMTVQYSKVVWDIVKPFWYIQFPWRYLLFVAVGSAFLGGFFLSIVQKRFGIVVAVGVGIVLSFLAVFQVRNYFHPQQYLPVSDSVYTSIDDIEWRVSRLSYEYVPKEVPTRLSAQNTTELAISPMDLPSRSYATIAGDIQVVDPENKIQKI